MTKEIAKGGDTRIINVDEIVINDRIRKDFGNVEELADDIRDNGLINPPVVTEGLELIAGERRVRAYKHLGYSEIEVRIVKVRDYEHQLLLEINENENRKDFTFSERMDYARQLEEIERKKAEERMLSGKKSDPVQNFAEGKRSRDYVAEGVGFGSGEQYRKAKKVADNGEPELIEKLDEGEISVHKAYQEVMAKLKEAERQKEAERKERERLEEENEGLAKTNEELSNRLEEVPKAVEPEVRVETRTEYVERIPEDYEELKQKAREYDALTHDRALDNPYGVELGLRLYDAIDKLSEWQKEFAWIADDVADLREMAKVDANMKREYDRVRNFWDKLDEIFYDGDIVDARFVEIK